MINNNYEKNEYDPTYNLSSKEKIAVVHITGGIDDSVARRVIKSLRQIKYDDKTKAVVLRIDSPGGSVTASEIILEECKDIQKPIICSFSNVAASGGYYISAYADRIFALPTTLTGSIGVFGIKFDLSDLARSYGVEVNFVSSGKHASTYDVFHPLTRQMKVNLERNMNKVYSYFKEIVSEGRGIPIWYVEQIAKGRVWTGEQAKEIGLIDELGGIDRALHYAKRKYTSNGVAEVEVWPKPVSLKDLFKQISSNEAEVKVSNGSPVISTSLNDRSNFIQLILSGEVNPSELLSNLPMTSRVLLTVDEIAAVELMLNEASRKGKR